MKVVSVGVKEKTLREEDGVVIGQAVAHLEDNETGDYMQYLMPFGFRLTIKTKELITSLDPAQWGDQKNRILRHLVAALKKDYFSAIIPETLEEFLTYYVDEGEYLKLIIDNIQVGVVQVDAEEVFIQYLNKDLLNRQFLHADNRTGRDGDFDRDTPVRYVYIK